MNKGIFKTCLIREVCTFEVRIPEGCPFSRLWGQFSFSTYRVYYSRSIPTPVGTIHPGSGYWVDKQGHVHKRLKYTGPNRDKATVKAAIIKELEDRKREGIKIPPRPSNRLHLHPSTPLFPTVQFPINF